ncbi:hypothetical protein [Streptomyces sp. NPDC003327]
MGNSRAYAVHRTTDALDAYERARKLVALLEYVDDTVYIDAGVRTVEQARRVKELFPGPTMVDHEEARYDPETGTYLFCELDLDTATDDEIRAELPLALSGDVPSAVAEAIAEAVVRAADQGQGTVEWHGRWPDDAESDSRGSAKYDGVQLLLHGDRAQIGDWTPHHTVFVHVDKWGDLPRAAKLAAHIGGEVLDGPELGW